MVLMVVGCRHGTPPSPIAKRNAGSVEGLPSFEEAIAGVQTISNHCEGLISEPSVANSKLVIDPSHQSNLSDRSDELNESEPISKNKKFQLNIHCKGSINQESFGEMSKSSDMILNNVRQCLLRSDLSLAQKDLLTLVEKNLSQFFSKSSSIFNQIKQSQEVVKGTEEALIAFHQFYQKKDLINLNQDEFDMEYFESGDYRDIGDYDGSTEYDLINYELYRKQEIERLAHLIIDRVNSLDELTDTIQEESFQFISKFNNDSMSSVGNDKNLQTFSQFENDNILNSSEISTHPIFNQIESLKKWSNHVREVLQRAGIDEAKGKGPSIM